jgi:hypothetical protein
MDPQRPKDFIDHIEAIAAEHGYFEPVDENYYQAFVELNQPQIEKLAIALMLDQEKGPPYFWRPERPGLRGPRVKIRPE